MSDNKPILYVFMRNDLPDPSPGKTLAQCNHAGSDFVIQAITAMKEQGLSGELTTAFEEWINEGGIGGTFGTCVVLSCEYSELLGATQMAEDYSLLSGVIIDPTYPIRNGHEMILAEIVTCGWAFNRKQDSPWNFPLY